MTTAIEKRVNGHVVRSLKTLVPLIKSEIKMGFQAGQRHWLAVGRLLNEARGHFPASGPNTKGLTFHDWVAEHFVHPMTGQPFAERTVQQWMQATRQLGSRAPAREQSMTSVVRKESPKHGDYNPATDWQAGVRKVQQTIDVDALAQRWEDEKKEERELRLLAMKIITAGYRALSAIVHPDKPGGSNQAMAKLTKAKKFLEEAIEA